MSTGTPRATSILLPPSPTAYPGGKIQRPQRIETIPTKPDDFLLHRPALGSGLTTPPFDDMSTTYHQSLTAYDNHATNGHSVPFAGPGLSKVAMTDPRAVYNAHHDSQQQHVVVPPQHSHNRSTTAPSNINHTVTTSHHAPRPASPRVEASTASHPTSPSKQDADTLIYHSLQIPKCISPKRGSLPDFAAQMTCLFWFQPIEDINRAELPGSSVAPLAKLAKPLEQFRKWVFNVLSTTQVTQNVILLALLFVYRLKKSTPQIKGRSGSEYRLLTVALMLGNKFLDDNTYTNKTWAEVSCFSVQEIHVMEVEFLSNMRYNLLTSKAEWDGWLVKLARFHDYYQTACLALSSPMYAQSPGYKSQSPIASPTSATVPDFSLYASGASQLSPTSSSHSQVWNAYQANTTSPLAYKPAMRPVLSRKRSHDEDLIDHPAKRQVPARPAYTAQPVDRKTANEHKLAAPQLSVVTTMPQQPTYAPPNSAYSATPQNVSLPPLQHGTRAMATVYPQSVTPAAQPTGPVPQAAPVFANSTGIPPQTHVIGTTTPSKRRSPGSLAQFMSSPMVEPFGPVSALHTPHALTPLANSPSVYLQQRASPYRPIRHVNTLLYPPPSASLDQYHISVPLPPSQMHYQPLGRRYDLRTGIVPEFVRYNRMQQTQGQPGQYVP